MSLIVNPGSRIAESGEGWTNTYQKAREHAEEWLEQIHADGITDVYLLDKAEPIDDAKRWEFYFHHPISHKNVTLQIDGIDDYVAYNKTYLFPPKVYWNGSSCSDPKIEDWASDGFEIVKTLRPADEKSGVK